MDIGVLEPLLLGELSAPVVQAPGRKKKGKKGHAQHNAGVYYINKNISLSTYQRLAQVPHGRIHYSINLIRQFLHITGNAAWVVTKLRYRHKVVKRVQRFMKTYIKRRDGVISTMTKVWKEKEDRRVWRMDRADLANPGKEPLWHCFKNRIVPPATKEKFLKRLWRDKKMAYFRAVRAWKDLLIQHNYNFLKAFEAAMNAGVEFMRFSAKGPVWSYDAKFLYTVPSSTRARWIKDLDREGATAVVTSSDEDIQVLAQAFSKMARSQIQTSMNTDAYILNNKGPRNIVGKFLSDNAAFFASAATTAAGTQPSEPSLPTTPSVPATPSGGLRDPNKLYPGEKRVSVLESVPSTPTAAALGIGVPRRSWSPPGLQKKAGNKIGAEKDNNTNQLPPLTLPNKTKKQSDTDKNKEASPTSVGKRRNLMFQNSSIGPLSASMPNFSTSKATRAALSSKRPSTMTRATVQPLAMDSPPAPTTLGTIIKSSNVKSLPPVGN
eukprot:TRINITY_DN112323_c0_g1_i1.p1 TRINITY_DN112323_c0_g1~~TRINITY_DN112323_c0_g1_i1.p1  ORF type:complete len:493 (+),score=11.91 TRINITY_DN112323_c0_g1_i1:75-1553(+)